MVNKVAQELEKNGVPFRQFAESIGLSTDRLEELFAAAGLSVSDSVSEDVKQKLLRHLQQLHGAKQEAAPDKIVLRRAKTSEIKLGGARGPSKTVSIQVRKKRTYVKRPASDEDAKEKWKKNLLLWMLQHRQKQCLPHLLKA